MEVPEPGLNLSHSCNNDGSFNPLHQVGDWTHASAATRAAAIGFLTYHAIVGTPDLVFLTLYVLKQKKKKKSNRYFHDIVCMLFLIALHKCSPKGET